MKKRSILLVALSVGLACSSGSGDYCATAANASQKLGNCNIPGAGRNLDQSRCESAVNGAACSSADRAVLATISNCINSTPTCQVGGEAAFQTAGTNCILDAGVDLGGDGGAVISISCAGEINASLADAG